MYSTGYEGALAANCATMLNEVQRSRAKVAHREAGAFNSDWHNLANVPRLDDPSIRSKSTLASEVVTMLAEHGV
jgi:hypothetical protein